MVGYYVATCKTSQSCLSQTELYSWIPKHMRRRPNLLHFSTMKLKGYASCWGSLWFLSTIRHHAHSPFVYLLRLTATGRQSGGNVLMQTRLSSNVCRIAGWSAPAASNGQTVYTWILKNGSKKLLLEKGFDPARLLSFLGPCWTHELL